VSAIVIVFDCEKNCFEETEILCRIFFWSSSVAKLHPRRDEVIAVTSGCALFVKHVLERSSPLRQSGDRPNDRAAKELPCPGLGAEGES
jgi:hypothetical protein